MRPRCPATPATTTTSPRRSAPRPRSAFSPSWPTSAAVPPAEDAPSGATDTPAAKEPFVKTMEMNAVATFNVSRLVAAAMATNEPDEEGERGVIVNTASIAGLEGQTGQLTYAAAKAAILGMTLPMARDLSILGIRVCAIAPGTMGTPKMLGVPEAMKEKLVENIQFPQRLGKPEEFALLVESIARNPYLNGENIRLDGALRFPPK